MSDPLGPYRPTVGIRQVRSDGDALEPATVLDIVGIPVTRDIGADGIPKYTLTISGVDFATVAAALAAADAPLDFNGQKLSNIAVPDANTDAATKLYVDTAAGAKVSSVAGSAPIVSSGGTTPTISINAATTSLPGSMSAADKTKLDAAASAATVSTLILRDSNGRAKVADPNTDDDIDTRGARNAAISAAAGGTWVWSSPDGTSNSATLNFIYAGQLATGGLAPNWRGWPNGIAVEIYRVEYVAGLAGSGSGNGVTTLWTGNPGSEVNVATLLTLPVTTTRHSAAITPIAVAAGSSVALKWNASGTVGSGPQRVVWVLYWRAV